MPKGQNQPGQGRSSSDPTQARGQQLRGDDTQDMELDELLEGKPKSRTQVDKKKTSSGQTARPTGGTQMKDKQRNQPR